MRLTVKDYFFVGIQVILFGLYLLDYQILKIEVPSSVMLIAKGVAITGLIIVALAILQLDNNLSPFPSPKINGALIKSGLYKFVRHPIYTGIICSAFGYGVYKVSVYKILIASILLLLFFLKSIYEERKLSEKFEDYVAYKGKTGRFFPKF